MIKRCCITKYVVIFALCVLVDCSCFAQGGVVAYATGRRFHDQNSVVNNFPSNAQLDRLTHVIAMGIGVETNTNGTYRGLWVRSAQNSTNNAGLPHFWSGTTQSAGVWNRNAQNRWLLEVVHKAHQRGVKVSICISGGSDERTHWINTLSSDNLPRFVDDIVLFVDRHNLDGVNINYEYPGRLADRTWASEQNRINEWDRHFALLQQLRSRLPGKIISISLSAADPIDNRNFYPLTTTPSQILNAVDAIYLMTYDEGGWPSHSHAERSIGVINRWETLAETIVLKSKLHVGSAFYGWSTRPIAGNMVPYSTYSPLSYSGNPGDRRIGLQDVQYKVNSSYDRGYGGVMIYELSFDPNALLLTALWNANTAKGGYLGNIPYNIYLQNRVERGVAVYNARNTIRAGRNVRPFSGLFLVGNYVVRSGANVTFRAANEIILSDGFIAEAGSTFRAYVEPFFTVTHSAVMPTYDAAEETSTTRASMIEGFSTEIFDFPEFEEISNEMDWDFRLMIYPNPAADNVTIEYHLNQSESVEISLHDHQGRLVYQLKNSSPHESGVYQITLSGINLPAGLYYCTLQTETKSVTERLIIVR